MASIISFPTHASAVEILNGCLDEAESSDIIGCIVIMKNAEEEFSVHSMPGIGAIERAGMCSYAQHLMLEKLEKIHD